MSVELELNILFHTVDFHLNRRRIMERLDDITEEEVWEVSTIIYNDVITNYRKYNIDEDDFPNVETMYYYVLQYLEMNYHH